MDIEVTYAIHDWQLSEHGGLDGVRDEGAIRSALARPRNLAAYGAPDAALLAAAYAFGLVRNHGFVDGNKRTAWVNLRLFLADNGYRFRFAPHDAVQLMAGVAAEAIGEDALVVWLRERL